jgi:hypothetical protein
MGFPLATQLKNAVDLGTVETFATMKMQDCSRSMSFGPTLTVLEPNVATPADFPKALFVR